MSVYFVQFVRVRVGLNQFETAKLSSDQFRANSYVIVCYTVLSNALCLCYSSLYSHTGQITSAA